MAEVLEIIETMPDDHGQMWPPLYLSEAAQRIDPSAVWARMESWTGHRWAPRPVTLIVAGPGPLRWPVRPFTIGAVERWGATWTETVLADGPLGPELGHGIYRITGTAGEANAASYEVIEAFKRLAEYMAATSDQPGTTSYSVTVGGALTENWKRDRATSPILQSGAADLLRSYRRMK